MRFNIPHYREEFFLQENQGNNAFDYEFRSEQHPEPYLRIAPIKEYKSAEEALENLRTCSQPAFQIKDNNLIKTSSGLQNFLVFPNPQNPSRAIFVFDNHNHAFYFWNWARQMGHFQTPPPLIHIDQHKDSRIPAEIISTEELENLDTVFEYTNSILNVGNFVPPALKTGLVSEFLLVDSEGSMLNFKAPEENFILDIDLDFFAPELDYIGNEKKLSLIRKLLPQAEVVTIATSPYFIDQKLAFQYLKRIFTF